MFTWENDHTNVPLFSFNFEPCLFTLKYPKRMQRNLIRDLIRIIRCKKCHKNTAQFYNSKTNNIYCDKCISKWKIRYCVNVEFLRQIVKRIDLYSQNAGVAAKNNELESSSGFLKKKTDQVESEFQDPENVINQDLNTDQMNSKQILSDNIPKTVVDCAQEADKKMNSSQQSETKKTDNESIMDISPDISSFNYTPEQKFNNEQGGVMGYPTTGELTQNRPDLNEHLAHVDSKREQLTEMSTRFDECIVHSGPKKEQLTEINIDPDKHNTHVGPEIGQLNGTTSHFDELIAHDNPKKHRMAEINTHFDENMVYGISEKESPAPLPEHSQTDNFGSFEHSEHYPINQTPMDPDAEHSENKMKNSRSKNKLDDIGHTDELKSLFNDRLSFIIDDHATSKENILSPSEAGNQSDIKEPKHLSFSSSGNLLITDEIFPSLIPRSQDKSTCAQVKEHLIEDSNKRYKNDTSQSMNNIKIESPSSNKHLSKRLSIDIPVLSHSSPHFPPNLLCETQKTKSTMIKIPVRTVRRKVNKRIRLRFCFSHLKKWQINYIENTLYLIKTCFFDYENVNCVAKATHLIVNSADGFCLRTYKYLYAGLRGIPILSFDFYLDFVRNLDITIFYKYIIRGDTGRGISTLPLNIFRSDKKIFQNITFYFKDCEISQECQHLISLAGGTIRNGSKQPDDIEIIHAVEIYDYISANNYL